MSKHTPGPWVVEKLGSTLGIRSETHHEGSPFTVADVLGISSAQQANARLIAAAPELLEALTLLEEWSAATVKQLGATSRPEMLLRVKRAQAAIAKATGGAA